MTDTKAREEAWTPGSWDVVPPGQTAGWGLCVGSPDYIVARIPSRGLPVEQRAANARLIAAAPDLLGVVDRLMRDGVIDFGAARAALAKVKGCAQPTESSMPLPLDLAAKAMIQSLRDAGSMYDNAAAEIIERLLAREES